MENIIVIDSLTYKIDNKLIFNNLFLNIKEKEWLTISGGNGSGKTTLVKIMTGLIKTSANIKICNMKLRNDNIDKINNYIGVVSIENSNTATTVNNEFMLKLEKLGYSRYKIKKRINIISNILNIGHLLNRKLNSLSSIEKTKIFIAKAIIHKPKILIIDEALSNFDNEEKVFLLNIIKKFNDEGLTVINITKDLSESFYSNRLIIISGGEILLEGSPKEVMNHDNILNKLSLQVPFEIELSKKLMLYNVIDRLYINIDEMVNNLWE